MSSDDGVRIIAYEDAMRSQVITLICSEHGGSLVEHEKNFIGFYEHPFQRERCIRLVAVDGHRVIGLIGLFYWPYSCGDERLASFQLGNSLVARDFRGRRIFTRLLGHLDDIREREHIDFLIGFPVKEAFGSFVRNHWTNPLDLTWYARIINPFTILSPLNLSQMQMQFDRAPELIEAYRLENAYSLAADLDFLEWRRQYREGTPYYFFHYSSPIGRVRFDLKPRQRGRIAELTIGDVTSTSPDAELLEAALRELIRAAQAQRFITILTIALNSKFRDGVLLRALRRCLFVRLKPKIHFIVKTFRASCHVEDPTRWRLFRSDIDTW
jgi:GNAT superfamily N-acetyltransferase